MDIVPLLANKMATSYPGRFSGKNPGNEVNRMLQVFLWSLDGGAGISVINETQFQVRKAP